jgi:predicted MPP superfamily phosphohydrolase
MPADDPLFGELAARMGPAALRQRLALESEQDAHHYRHPGDFVRIEHLGFAGRAIAVVLHLCGMRGRGRRNALDIRLVRNELRLPRLPSAFAGCTLLHLSDLHLDAGTKYLQALIERVRGIAADACVLTGDFRFATEGSTEGVAAGLRQLVPALPRPVFAVLGNHDGIATVPALQALGVRVLLNEHAVLERGAGRFVIAGIDDAHYFRTHDLARAAAGVPRDACALLLSHTPAAFREAAAHGFAGMLSGHTHGGQICLPGGFPLLTDTPAPRRLARGAWVHEGMAGYTSAGCGCSVVDARFQCPPEVTLHTLRAA